MPKIEGNVIEEWSKVPVANATVTADGDFLARTNKAGWFTGTLPVGAHRVCVAEPGHETTCQNMNLVSDTAVNISIKPVFRAL